MTTNVGLKGPPIEVPFEHNNELNSQNQVDTSWLSCPIKWLRAEGETPNIQFWKRVAAIAIAVFLALSILGIPVLVQAVREWKRQESGGGEANSRKEVEPSLGKNPLSSPIAELSNDILSNILSLCSVKDQVAFGSCSRKHKEAYESDARLQKLRQIAKNLSGVTLSAPVAHASCWKFDPARQELLVGQAVDYKSYGKDYAIVFDENFKAIDSLEKKGFFCKTIEKLIPAKDGNVIVASGYNENRVVYWDRKNNEATEVRQFNIFDQSISSVQIAYSPVQGRFYLGVSGIVEVYEETPGKPELIETIHLPVKEGLVWMMVDEELNQLWMMTNSAQSKLIGYDLRTKDFHDQDNPFNSLLNINYDHQKKWLIGSTKEETFLIWDTQTTKKLQEIKIPLESSLEKLKLHHYNPDKKWLFFFLQEKESEAWNAETISGRLLIWDIEKDAIITPLLEKEFVYNGMSFHINDVNEIHYDSESEVVFFRSIGLLLAWDLKTGYLIPSGSYGEKIQNLTAEKFIFDEASSKIFTVTKYPLRSLTVDKEGFIRSLG